MIKRQLRNDYDLGEVKVTPTNDNFKHWWSLDLDRTYVSCDANLLVVRDPSGLYHYVSNHLSSIVAAEAAVRQINNSSYHPAWLWFNNTPIPISLNDTRLELVNRYHRFYRALRDGNHFLRDVLRDYTESVALDNELPF